MEVLILQVSALLGSFLFALRFLLRNEKKSRSGKDKFYWQTNIPKTCRAFIILNFLPLSSLNYIDINNATVILCNLFNILLSLIGHFLVISQAQ